MFICYVSLGGSNIKDLYVYGTQLVSGPSLFSMEESDKSGLKILDRLLVFCGVSVIVALCSCIAINSSGDDSNCMNRPPAFWSD